MTSPGDDLPSQWPAAPPVGPPPPPPTWAPAPPVSGPPPAPPAWAPPPAPPQAWPHASPGWGQAPPGGGAAEQARAGAAAAGSFVRGVTRRIRDGVDRERLDRGRDAAARRMQQVQQAAQRIDTTRVTTTATRAGRVAAEHTNRAARRTVTAFAEFWIGVGTFWRGLWAFVTRPVLWLYALLPAVVVYLLSLAGLAGVDLAKDGVAGWVGGLTEGWPGVLRWAMEATVGWAVGALGYAVVGFLTVMATLLVGAPFYVLIVRRLQRHRDPARPGWLRSTGFAMSQTVLVTLVVTGGGAVLVPLLLIPGVNLLAAVVIALLFDGFLIGLLAVGLPLYQRAVTGRRDHLRYAWRRRWPVLGFGVMCTLALSVPFTPLRWLTVPAVFVGAVLLHRRFPHDAPHSPHHDAPRDPRHGPLHHPPPGVALPGPPPG